MFEEIYDLRKKDKINQRGIIMTIDLDKMHKFYEQKKLIQQEIRNKNNSLKINDGRKKIDVAEFKTISRKSTVLMNTTSVDTTNTPHKL
tara:strand:- start:366 stop:632 length:267 start_codon:yes stop_codon:yes gene_type:complete